MTADDSVPSGIDTTVAHGARIYDYLLNGKDNFEVDRNAAEAALASAPILRTVATENRAFLGRVVRFLAAEAGIRQFIDIGTGLPTQNNVHQIAQAAAPGTRVVYVDNDPIVLAHGRALLSVDETTTVIQADIRQPGEIFHHPQLRELIDFDEPVAILLIGVMHFVSHDEDPAGIMSYLRDAVVPGSYLAVSQITADRHPEAVASAVHAFGQGGSHGTPRSREEIEQLFAGCELIEPGLVYVPEWRPDSASEHSGWILGGVGRKL